MEAGFDFIVDLPWLNEENYRGTFELIMRLPQPFFVSFHSLSFLPGAAITERALAEGKITPDQIARRHRPMAERFELFLWKGGLGASDRQSTLWHSLLYLAGTPFMPRRMVWRLYRWRGLLQFFPRPLAVAAEAAPRAAPDRGTQVVRSSASGLPRAGRLARTPSADEPRSESRLAVDDREIAPARN